MFEQKSTKRRRRRLLRLGLLTLGIGLLIVTGVVSKGRSLNRIETSLVRNETRLIQPSGIYQEQEKLNCQSVSSSLSLADQDLTSVAVKDNAIHQIEVCRRPLIQELTDRYNEVQEKRLAWYGWTLMLVLPLVGFIGFMLFPRFLGHTIGTQIAGVSPRRLYKLYFIQALVAFSMLFVLGGCLWFCQFWLGRLNGETNPQLILQEEETNYLAHHSTKLVNLYPELFVPLAQDLTTLPDEAILALVMESGLKLRPDPLLSFEADLINFTWPTLSTLFFITFGLLLVLFLQRIWPDVKTMLHYPVEVVLAEQAGEKLELSTWSAARKLMRVELKVMGVFAGLSIGIAFLMSFFLQQFFKLLIELLVEVISGGMSYFVRVDGSALIVMVSTSLILVFLIEAVAIFMLAFGLLVGKVTGNLRDRYKGSLTKKESRRARRQYYKGFFWIIALAVGLSLGLSILATFFISLMTASEKPQWIPILLGVPLLLLVGLNLGMWLLRGFKMLNRLLPDFISLYK